MLEVLIAVAVAAFVVLAAGWWLRRSSRRSSIQSHEASKFPAVTAAQPKFPPAGLLVPDEVLRSAGSSPAAIWDALESATAPIAIEYYPVSEAEIAKFRTLPVNASAQQAMVNIVNALDPKSPTLYRVVLPKGAELVKAAGQSGFRGFSRTAGKTTHAVLKPVAASGAIAAGWPVFAVAATVMAVDMASQREQRAHQRQVQAILRRQEERHYLERIKDQRSADAQLSRAISLMLDGRNPHMELALKSADDEFHRAQQFLESFLGAIDGLMQEDGKVDYRQLEVTVGGEAKDVDYFIRDLHLSRAAIAIKRKALVADAASVALADPSNPYEALRKFLSAEVLELEQAAVAVTDLTNQLMQIELKGPWYNREKTAAQRQEQFRVGIAPARLDEEKELLYLVTDSGEILQLLPSGEDQEPQPPVDEL